MPSDFLKTRLRARQRIQAVLLTSLTQLGELAVHNLCLALFMDCKAACESLAKEMPVASGLTLSLLLRGRGSGAVWALESSKQSLPSEDELCRRRRLHLALPQRWVPQAAGMLNLSPYVSCLCHQKEETWAPCWHNSLCSYFSNTPTAVRRVMVQTRILPPVSRAVTQLASPLWNLNKCLVMNEHPAASHSFKKQELKWQFRSLVLLCVLRKLLRLSLQEASEIELLLKFGV